MGPRNQNDNQIILVNFACFNLLDWNSEEVKIIIDFHSVGIGMSKDNDYNDT